jgi:hypothetical protein
MIGQGGEAPQVGQPNDGANRLGIAAANPPGEDALAALMADIGIEQRHHDPAQRADFRHEDTHSRQGQTGCGQALAKFGENGFRGRGRTRPVAKPGEGVGGTGHRGNFAPVADAAPCAQSSEGVERGCKGGAAGSEKGAGPT